MIAMTQTTGYAADHPAAVAGLPAGRASIKKMFLECAACAFEPGGGIRIPRGRCPKCHTWSWRRAVRLELVNGGAQHLG